MKKQITTLSRLFIAFIMLSFTLSLSAESRIYILGDAAGIPSDPSYKTYMYDDIWIWQEDWTAEKAYTAAAEAGVDEAPTGMYIQYTAQVNSYIGLSYVWTSPKDLTQVTDDWYLHMQVKTNATTTGDSFKMIIKGANSSEATLEFNEDVYPIASRDNTTWYEITIPMYEFFDAGLDLSQATAGTTAYLNFLVGGVTPQVSQFAIDNVYFTDGGASGINKTKEVVDYVIQDDMLTISDGANASIYNVQGGLVMNVEGSASLASLQNGVYILRSGNKVAKFLR